jgi:hypothetical protein
MQLRRGVRLHRGAELLFVLQLRRMTAGIAGGRPTRPYGFSEAPIMEISTGLLPTLAASSHRGPRWPRRIVVIVAAVSALIFFVAVRPIDAGSPSDTRFAMVDGHRLAFRPAIKDGPLAEMPWTASVTWSRGDNPKEPKPLEQAKPDEAPKP